MTTFKSKMKNLLIFLILVFAVPQVKSQDDNDSWYSVYMKTGETPKCFRFTSRYDYTIDNYLKVYVGSKTDVVLKLVRCSDNVCIRSVFINSGDTYFITNIPQGLYYVKIAFGLNWSRMKSSFFCIEKFLDKAIYQKGEDLLDYYLISTYGGYQVPSYSLELRVYETTGNSFETSEISEEEFME